jgi:hypothetical protein
MQNSAQNAGRVLEANQAGGVEHHQKYKGKLLDRWKAKEMQLE